MPPDSSKWRLAALGLVAVALTTGGGTAAGQALPGVEEYARAIATLTAPRWEGPRAPWPLERDRPAATLTGRAIDAPIAVHGSAGTRPEALEAVLGAAVRMHEALGRRGFAAPRGDGDLGGGPELDFYLAPSEVPYEAVSDGPTPFSYLDGVVDHVVLDASLEGARLEACAAEAYVDALLLQQDPAEALATRRAIATYYAFLETGRFDGCTDDVALAQRRPALGWTSPESPPGAAALFVAMLGLRGDDGDGAFVRETATMARQRTWEGDALRASPDFYEAIATSAELVDASLDRYLVDAAIARFALGDARRAALSRFARLDGLPEDYAVRVAYEGRFAALPMRTAPHEPKLEPGGSAYARIATAGAGTTERLRVFLRGESGTRWSLVVLGVGSAGTEVRRVEAPIRDREPNAYAPLELAEVTEAIVVVTNLGLARLDADAPPTEARTFHLIIDRASD